jgi:hypothetical protein
MDLLLDRLFTTFLPFFIFVLLNWLLLKALGYPRGGWPRLFSGGKTNQIPLSPQQRVENAIRSGDPDRVRATLSSLPHDTVVLRGFWKLALQQDSVAAAAFRALWNLSQIHGVLQVGLQTGLGVAHAAEPIVQEAIEVAAAQVVRLEQGPPVGRAAVLAIDHLRALEQESRQLCEALGLAVHGQGRHVEVTASLQALQEGIRVLREIEQQG